MDGDGRVIAGVIAGVVLVLAAAALVQRGARRRIAARAWIAELDAGPSWWRDVVDTLPESIRADFLPAAGEWRLPAPAPSGAFMRYAGERDGSLLRLTPAQWADVTGAREVIRSPYAP